MSIRRLRSLAYLSISGVGLKSNFAKSFCEPKAASSSDTFIDVKIEDFKHLIKTCLISESQPPEDAEICADTLIYAGAK